MSHAEKCPVCGGDGTVEVFDATTTAGNYKKTCNGCGGKGWVTVYG